MKTNELIPISEHDGKRAVSARDLHAFLESKRDFSNWIKDRIKKYGLVENQDYEVLLNFEKNPDCLLNDFGEQTGRGGYNRIEYALSISAAKSYRWSKATLKASKPDNILLPASKG
jgi:anti-repressor protein